MHPAPKPLPRTLSFHICERKIMVPKAHHLRIQLPHIKCLAWRQAHNKCSLDDIVWNVVILYRNEIISVSPPQEGTCGCWQSLRTCPHKLQKGRWGRCRVKAVRHRCNRVAKMKSTVMQGTDVVCSLASGTGKARCCFYVIAAKKAQPESGPKETWADPDLGTWSGAKGLCPLQCPGCAWAGRTGGRLQAESDQRDGIAKCDGLGWTGPGPERGQRLCWEFFVQPALLLFTEFEIISKGIIVEQCLYASSCLEEAMGAKLKTRVCHFSWNCMPASKWGRQPECPWSAFFWWLQVMTGNHRAKGRARVRGCSLLLGKDEFLQKWPS